MKTGYLYLSLISFLTILTCSCAPFQPNSVHAGTCNQLNSDIIFNGNTSNIRQAEIQDAETPLAQHNFDRKCE